MGGHARHLLFWGALASCVGVALFRINRTGLAWSAALFAGLAFAAGGRTLAGSALRLAIAPRCKLQAMSVRTAAVQFGYLIGAGAGGAALAVGGYRGLGLALAVMYLVAALPHIPRGTSYASAGPAGPASHGAT